MKSSLARVLLIAPLLWVLTLSVAFAAPKKGRVKASSKRAAKTALQPASFGAPVAVLGTPEKNIQVFRLTRHESANWTYMVVIWDEDGSHTFYGEERTVGLLLENLGAELKPTAGTGGRCPAAASWRFESTGLKVSYCAENFDTRRIERAVSWLETSPLVVEKTE